MIRLEGVTVILPGATGSSATSSSSEAKHAPAMNTETRVQQIPAEIRPDGLIIESSLLFD
jgi:hypothetical protein